MKTTIVMVDKAINNTIAELVSLAGPRATEPHFNLAAYAYGKHAVSVEGERDAMNLFTVNLAVLMAQAVRPELGKDKEVVNVKALMVSLAYITDVTQIYDDEFIVDGIEFQILLDI